MRARGEKQFFIKLVNRIKINREDNTQYIIATSKSY